MAEKSIIISAEEEAILLKPIDEYVGKIQEQIDALRVEGSDKVNSLKNQIAIAKENKNLTKEEQNKIIGECKKNLENWQKAGYDCRNWPVIFGIDGLDDALEAIKTGKMKGTVYNDKEDQAMELAKLSLEIVCGKDTNRKHLKEGRYYVSEYCRVDSSNVDHFLK